MSIVYKIVASNVWARLVPGTAWSGTALDERDGYIHLSTAAQVAGTLAKHYAGVDGLVLLAIPESALPQEDLRWEESRGGQLFPHLYTGLDPAWVDEVHPLPVGPDGHALPAGVRGHR